jgi:hypothetical protein
VGALETMTTQKKGPNSFPLRMTPTMRRQIDHLAKREGVSLNQFISLAVAEKVMRMEGYSLSDGPEIRWVNGRMKGVKKV